MLSAQHRLFVGRLRERYKRPTSRLVKLVFLPAHCSLLNSAMGQCLTKETNQVVFATPDVDNSSSGANVDAIAELSKSPGGSDAVQAEEESSGSKLGDQPGGGGTKSQFLALISTPSAIDTAQLTTIYRVPDDKYASPEDVFKERGIELLDMIDEGGFAKVMKARREADPSEVMACKMVEVGADLSDNAKWADVKNELFVLEKIKHPHIVRLYEHFVINETLYIFMQLADAGNLYRFLYLRKGPMTEAEAKKPFSQIVSGTCFMHGQKIAHRDLKLSNILLKTLQDGSIACLLADFGLSRVVFRRTTGLLACKSYCGTPNYMAPELKQRSRYNAFDIDMYALGVMLFVVVQGSYPFDAEDDGKALQQAIKPKPEIQWNTDMELSETCRTLLCALMEPSAAKRMSMRELIAHKWFAEEMATIHHTLPPLDQLPKKAATRRFSSPADDIRLRPRPEKSASKQKRRPKSTDKAKGKRRVKSADGKRRIKSADGGGRSSIATRGKKSAERTSKVAKRKPKSAETRTRSSSKQRVTSKESIGGKSTVARPVKTKSTAKTTKTKTTGSRGTGQKG